MVGTGLLLTLLVVHTTHTAAIRLPGTGGGLRLPGEVARPPPLQRGRRPLGAPPATNASAVHLADALGRHWLIYERAFSLVLRVASKSFQRLGSWLGLLVNYPPRVAVVTMSGVIAHESELSLNAQAVLDPALVSDEALATARRTGELINLERFDAVLSRAFRASRCRAVALVINSPGGSPAQSSLIYQRLRALRKRFPRKQLLAYVHDSAASGGYYIACAADEIIVDTNSIVGSIGVVSRGFGYVSALKKQGVERRVHTAGESKAGLDPYLPIKGMEMQNQRRLLHELHANFIGAVKDGRGDRLKPEAAARSYYRTSVAAAPLSSRLPSSLTAPGRSTLRKLQARGAGLFDGSVYSGSAAVEVGLVDGVGELGTDAIRRFGRHVQLTPILPDEPIDYSRLLRWLL